MSDLAPLCRAPLLEDAVVENDVDHLAGRQGTLDRIRGSG